MKFPEKPIFYLNDLECRLIAPWLAFQKIFQGARRGQLKITGDVVKVPADVTNTVNILSHETGFSDYHMKLVP